MVVPYRALAKVRGVSVSFVILSIHEAGCPFQLFFLSFSDCKVVGSELQPSM
jgi:hypothetical protein